MDYTTKVVLAHICIIVLSIYALVGSWLPLAAAERRVIEELLKNGSKMCTNCVGVFPTWKRNALLKHRLVKDQI